MPKSFGTTCSEQMAISVQTYCPPLAKWFHYIMLTSEYLTDLAGYLKDMQIGVNRRV